MRHALTRALRETLRPRRAKDLPRFLRLLDRQLAAIERLAEGDLAALPIPGDRPLARKVLRGVEDGWTDGDENLVRGHLDRFERGGGGPVASAQRLRDAAQELVRIGAPRGAVSFFVWEMESMLTSPGDLAMIAARKAGQSRSGGR